MSATKYDNGNTSALQIVGNEGTNKLTILQSASVGKELVFTNTDSDTATSVVVNDIETLRKIRDFL
ncbi:hypothetical protein, partial [Bifidobacterium adolescentis]|uniref:hypothetical protein n=1 Tax=Bifidobacterium adolescentis TaxID=1680 RepID=UPI004063A6B4